MSATITQPTVADYARVFHVEQQQTYLAIDAFEARCGFAIDRVTLEASARVLACPVKKHPPSWQHGRVIYSAIRRYLAKTDPPFASALDIGTAKGFSALCAEWAGQDSGVPMRVTSVDVIDPASREPRNTVADCDGPKTLAEILAPWKPDIEFLKSTGIDWLQNSSHRVHVAFIDGKHNVLVVRREGEILALRQQAGDVAIFDDLQLIGPAIDALERNGLYAFERLYAKPDRGYAIGVRQ